MSGTTRRLALAGGLTLWAALCGCGQFPPSGQAVATDNDVVAPPSDAETGSRTRTDDGPVDIAGEPFPLQFPHRPADAGDDAANPLEPPAGPGVVETLRRTVESSPVFEESGVQEELLDGLAAAQDEMARIKRENRRALRDASRQVRVGSAANAPNLLLITANSVGYGDLSCYGQSRYATPHLDRLAADGVRFRQFYAGSADSRGARWCLLTGQNSGRATPPRKEPPAERFVLSDERKTLADVLWQAGYGTGFIGAWDLTGLPIDHGYDEWTGFRTHREAAPYPEAVYVDAVKARLLKNEGGRREVAASSFLVEEGLSFIARHAAAGRPFFLHLALPAEIAEASADAGDTPRGPESRLTELDETVGRITRWLKESNLAGKTCVLFLGECAPPARELAVAPHLDRTAGLRVSPDGLGEGNLRVPLIVSWPGRVAGGTQCDHACAAWDLLPTLADLAGAQRRPPSLDGLSFAPSLRGHSQREHALLYWESRGNGFGQAVLKGQWKGVRHAGQSTLELFDLAADPREQADLAARRPEIVEQLIVRRR